MLGVQLMLVEGIMNEEISMISMVSIISMIPDPESVLLYLPD